MSMPGAAAGKSSPIDQIKPGIKVCAQMSPEPSETDLAFVRQMGVEHAVLWTDATKSSAEYYASRKKLFADNGIDVYGFGNSDVHNQPAIVLRLANFDDKVEEYKRHLQALGKAGIPYTTYAHMPNGIWSTEREQTRGGADARGFDVAKATAGRWRDTEYHLPMTNEREYSDDELWDNWATLIRQVAPVAENENVMIGIHPDDPPIPRLGGVPRCSRPSPATRRRSRSPTARTSASASASAAGWRAASRSGASTRSRRSAHFGEQKKLFKVHFRNVDAPMPHFVETFVDDGYFDMYPAMRALQQVGFRGVVIPDHIPRMADDPRLGTAYTIGYMKALVKRAEDEVGRG